MSDLLAAIGGTVDAWERLRWDDLQFAQFSTAILLIAVLVAAPLLVLLARGLGGQPRRRVRVALPAVLSVMRRSPLSPARHAAFLLFVLGIPFFAVAMADPRSGSVREEVTYSGRRIAILIDGSGSMVLPFEAPKLSPVIDRTFYTAVTAAERFVRLRIAGKNSDRLAIIEFGNEAYIVTPFTTDYDNVVLSLRLIGEPRAWNRFNVFGTTIIQGLEQGLQLFRTFNLLDGSDNMMVLFTDGNDGETMFRGRTLDDMMLDARKNAIPIFMVRLGYGKRLGDVTYDALWKPAVERSGGRFYVADNEDAILRAVSDIDRLAVGRIAERRFAAASPEFAGYALVAIALWLAAGTLKLAFPWFRTFP
jgi:Ca-activated chloride channel family protein